MTDPGTAEAALAALAALPHAVWVFGPDHRLRLANAAARAMAGAAAAALPPGTPYATLVRTLASHGFYGEGDPDALAAAQQDLDPSRPGQRRIRRADGGGLDQSVLPLPAGGFLLTWTPATPAEAATERLHALEAMRHGVVLYDAEARLVAANALGASYSSLGPADMLPGRPLAHMLELQRQAGAFGPEPAATAQMRALLALDRRQRHTYRRTTPDGRTLDVHSAPTADGGFVVTHTDVTDLVRAQDMARERAAQLQAMQDGMRHGIALFGPDRRLSIANRLAACLLGVPDETLRPGLTIEEIAQLQLRQGVFGEGAAAEAEARAVVARDRSLIHPVRRRVRDGRVIDSISDPTPDGGFVVTWTDATARVEAETAVAEHAAVLQAMLDTMRIGVALFGPDHRYRAGNRLAGTLAGLPEPIAPGTSFAALATAQRRHAVSGDPRIDDSMTAKALAADRSRPQQHVRPTRDGRMLEVFSDPLPDGGFVVTLNDITPLARAEAEAKQRAATQAVMLDVIRHGIHLFGPDRRLVAANRLGAVLSGAPAEQLQPGIALEQVLRLQQAAGVFGPEPEGEAMVQRLLTIDRGQPYVARRRSTDGRLIEVVSDPTPDGGFAVTFSDVSALAAAEEAAASRARILQTALDTMRHGLLIFDRDRRLLAANSLAAALSDLGPEDMRPGTRLDDLIRRQHAGGHFGPEPEATAIMRRILEADRAQSGRRLRRQPDGRQIEVCTDPTPDGGFVISFTDVTARAAAEVEAKRRAAMLRDALDSMRHALVLFGPDRRLLTANRLAGPDFHLPPLQGRAGITFAAMVQEQLEAGRLGTGAEAEAARERILAEDRSRPLRYRRRQPDGKVIEVGSDPTPDGGFVITHTDVTDLARAQAEALERAATLQLMLDTMRHGIAQFDRDKRLVTANRLAAELNGIDPAMLRPGVHAGALALAAVRAGLVTEAERQAGLREDYSRPLRRMRTHTDGRVIEIAVDPTPDGGFVATYSDVTALIRAEAEASRRAAVLQVMLDNIRHGIALFDREGRIQAVNPVFLALLELPESVMASGGSFTAFIEYLEARGDYGPGEAGRAAAARLKALDRRLPHRNARTRPNGVVLEVASEPVPDGGWVLALTDVTEDRRIRAELERAKDAAEAASRAKSRFLATMTHELRTPLNAVIGFAEAFAVDPHPVRGPDYVRSIHEAGRHLLSLIDNILDVTRAETTGFAIVEGEVAVIPLIESAVRVMQGAAATAGVSLQAVLPPALPLLQGDELRLRQVLLNLASNAVKFTPRGGTVTLSAVVEEEGLVIRVADSGIGMRPEDIPRVFEPFSQLDSSLARRFPGSGLGLYLSRALAEAQGAALTLESTPGIGTTALLRFPKSRLLTSVAA
jgi:signal transduction histidine kinase